MKVIGEFAEDSQREALLADGCRYVATWESSAGYDQAKNRLDKHYERSMDAKWTCPDYLRVDLAPSQKT